MYDTYQTPNTSRALFNVKLNCRCYIAYTCNTFCSSVELLFTLILGDGALLSCGYNKNGQLGRDGEESEFLPVKMSFKPISVAAGPYHSLAICQLDESNDANVGTRKIASWGWNQHYELGRWGEIPNQDPGLTDGLDGENPVSISAGLGHSLALTSKGKLWVWGAGLFNTLGYTEYGEPEKYYVDSLKDFQILQAVAGFAHNLVLVAD